MGLIGFLSRAVGSFFSIGSGSGILGQFGAFWGRSAMAASAPIRAGCQRARVDERRAFITFSYGPTPPKVREIGRESHIFATAANSWPGRRLGLRRMTSTINV
jgi:hypothetical protein